MLPTFVIFRLSNIAAILNGIGGAVPFAGPARVSSVWFPPDQRATATSIVSFANYFGVAMAFIIGELRTFINTFYETVSFDLPV